MKKPQNFVILDFDQKGTQISLSDNFKEFKKKLSMQQREITKDEEITYYDDKKKKYRISSSPDYDKVCRINHSNIAGRIVISKTPQDEDEFQIDMDRADQKEIFETPCDQFFSFKTEFECLCQKKMQEDCKFCQNKGTVQFSQHKEGLEAAFKEFLTNNLQKLKEFIQINYELDKKDMESFYQWVHFHGNLLNLHESSEQFFFVCTICKNYKSKQAIAYVRKPKNKYGPPTPQHPVCLECYSSLKNREPREYQELVSRGKRFVEINQPPNLLKRGNSKT